MEIVLHRIHESHAPPGRRVLVDRLWPRGISKQEAELDDWPKEIAPSSELRRWFAHDPRKWGEFRRRYLSELSEKKDLARKILADAREAVRLVSRYGAKHEEHNNARVLREYLGKLWVSRPY